MLKSYNEIVPISVISGRLVVKDRISRKTYYLDNNQEFKFPEGTVGVFRLSNGNLLYWKRWSDYIFQRSDGKSYCYSIISNCEWSMVSINKVVEVSNERVAIGTNSGVFLINGHTGEICSPVFFEYDDIYDLIYLQKKNQLIVSTSGILTGADGGGEIIDLETLSNIDTFKHRGHRIIAYDDDFLMCSSNGLNTRSTIISREEYDTITKLRDNAFIAVPESRERKIEVWVNGKVKHIIDLGLRTFFDHTCTRNVHRINDHSFAYTVASLRQGWVKLYIWSDPDYVRTALLPRWRHCFTEAYRDSGERDRRKFFRKLTST